MSSPPVPPPEACIVLESRELAVVVLPESGADIYSITHLGTGVDLLWKSPWGWRDSRSSGTFASTQDAWLARCAGGWSTLVPNAGAERVVAGSRRGYHGEAATVPWSVSAADGTTARLELRLVSAPLQLVRTVSVQGRAVRVDQQITNVSAVPVEVSWVEHPAFGAEFAAGADLLLPAATFIADAEAPGTHVPAGTVAPVDRLTDRYGDPSALGRLPCASEPRSLFGAITDFEIAEYTVRSPAAGLEVRVGWDRAAFPHAWIWQECHASAEHPWYRTAYAVAVEPANVLPGSSPAGQGTPGVGVLLGAGKTLTGTVSLHCSELSPVT